MAPERQSANNWLGSGPLKLGSSLDFMTEDLRPKYSAIADDSELSGRRREAAMYLSLASGHLENEDYDEAEALVDNAIDSYRKLEDLHELADSLRLQVQAICRKAATEPASSATLQTTERAIRPEIIFFREKEDKYGEVLMLLALAELQCGMKTGPRVSEALENVLDAQDIAADLGNTKLEAMVACELCTVLTKHHRYKNAVEAGKDAQKKFKSLGDLKSESRCLFVLGEAQAQNGCGESGFHFHQRALTLSKRLKDRKMEAKCLCAMSNWCLTEKEEYQQGTSLAQQALDIYQDEDNIAGWFSAHLLLLQGYVGMKDLGKALKLAEDGVDDFRRHGGINKYFVKALSELAKVHMQRSDQKQALEKAAQAQEFAEEVAREITDPRPRVEALETVAEIYEHFEMYDLADENCWKAAQLIQDLKNYEEEAHSILFYLARLRIKNDDIPNARNALERALQVARRVQHNYLEGRALLGIAGCWWGEWPGWAAGLDDAEDHAPPVDKAADHPLMDKAKKAANLAIECFIEEGYDRGHAYVLSLALYEFHLSEHDYDSATTVVREAFSIAKDANDKRTQALIKIQEVNLFFTLKRVDQAAQAAGEALSLSRILENKRLTAISLIYVINANYEILMSLPQEKRQPRVWDQSVQKLARKSKEALGLALKLGKPHELEGWAYLWQAKVCGMQRLERECRDASEKAQVIAQQIGYAFLEVDAMVELAIATDALGDRPRAQVVLEDAYGISTTVGYEHGKVQSASLLEDMSSRRRDSQAGRSRDWVQCRQEGQSSQQHVPGLKAQGYRRPDLAQVRGFIADQVKGIVGRDKVVSGDEPVIDLGMDSLASVELRAQLQQEFSISLPSSFMSDFATVNEMANILLEQCIMGQVEWRKSPWA